MLLYCSVNRTEFLLCFYASIPDFTSPFSHASQVPPSGAPIIAPAPHIVSYDENSVTLSRHHIRHYRNHNDFNKIFVRVTEESGTSRELEFAVFFLISFLIFSLLYLLRLLA